MPPPSRAVMEEKLTMRPMPCFFICWAPYFIMSMVPRQLTARTRSKTSVVISSRGVGQAMPAMFARPTTGGISAQ